MVSWSQFKTMIEYKAKWYGKQIVTVAKTFLPVSFALVVATKIRTLKISDYVSGMPECHTHHDRDINESLNLKNEAVRLLTVGVTGIA